jgi:hypothetical protein
MASSVLSERMFSAAGLTITKHRTRLRGDIVEALQVLRAAFQNDDVQFAKQPCLELEDKILLEEKAEDEDIKSLEELLGLELASDLVLLRLG